MHLDGSATGLLVFAVGFFKVMKTKLWVTILKIMSVTLQILFPHDTKFFLEAELN